VEAAAPIGLLHAEDGPMTIIQPTRRGFITGFASLIAAPAIVHVSSIMPVKVMVPLRPPGNIITIDMIGGGYLYSDDLSDMLLNEMRAMRLTQLRCAVAPHPTGCTNVILSQTKSPFGIVST
jgi:hypothetical protein